MDECKLIVNKHELFAFKQYFDVSIKLISSLIRSIKVKNEDKYFFMMTNSEAMLENMKDFSIITEDHIILGEDMILNFDYCLLENLIKYMELILIFCRHEEYKKSAGLENIRRICIEGIRNEEILTILYKRMNLALYMSSSSPA